MRWCLCLFAMLWSAPLNAECRQALVLALDVSGSVDAKEYRIQLDGLAAALLHPEVQNAFLALPEDSVRVMVFEWAGPGFRRIIIPWVQVDREQDLREIAFSLRQTTRKAADPATALGEAMISGLSFLDEQQLCRRKTIDISGDGQSNAGPRPRDVEVEISAADVTINGLAIETGHSGTSALSRYYQNEVIQGRGAFVERAGGFAGFEDAMVRKLLRELQILVVGNLKQY